MKIAELVYSPDSDGLGHVTYQKTSMFKNLNIAIENLRKSENIPAADYKKIGYINLKKGTHRTQNQYVANEITKWLNQHKFEAAIWSEPSPKPTEVDQYLASLTEDFHIRDQLPQTFVPKDDWFLRRYGRWGPQACTFPKPTVPKGVDPIQWKRDRVVAAAKHYAGLPYMRSDGMRGHIPDRGCGLDCSNFASWVYNYALGIRFTSNIDDLVDSDEAGRQLAPEEPLKKGDLLFLNGKPKHVVIYIDENHIIDSTSSRRKGVQVRDLRLSCNRWYRPTSDNPRFLCARRVIN